MRILNRVCDQLVSLAGLLAAMVAMVSVAAARGQCPEAWLPGEDPPGVNSMISDSAVLPGGDIIVGGGFTRAGKVDANSIARYSFSTSSWSSLGSGTNGTVLAILVLPGGDLVVGGSFTSAGGIPANIIARYSFSSNSWSSLGSGTNGFVSAIAVLPGGDLIVGGQFTIAGGVTAINISRYNPTTNSWSALGSGVRGGYVPGSPGIYGSYPGVYDLLVLPGGDVVVAGQFTFAGDLTVNHIARYTPDINAWSAMGGGIQSGNRYAYALALTTEGDVLVGGEFNEAGGIAAHHLARYNLSTDTWSNVGAGRISGDPYRNFVTSILSLPSGEIIIGGQFTTIGELSARCISRFNPATNSWSALGSGTNSYVKDLMALQDGDLILAGAFSSAGDVAYAGGIARYNLATNAWMALGNGLAGNSPTVEAFFPLSDGDLIVAGGFVTAGGKGINRVGRYSPANETWTALGVGITGGFSSISKVYAVAELNETGDIVAAGNFSRVGVLSVNNIARFNPATGIWSSLGSGLVGGSTGNSARPASALAQLPNGELIVGGRFTTAGGVPASNIARYTPETNSWSALGSGTNGQVNAMIVLPSGDLIVGGTFTIAGGIPASKIARFSPATNSWSALGSGLVGGTDGQVYALLLLASGDLIIGGRFYSGGGVSASNIVRYTPSTNSWSALGGGIGSYNIFSSPAVLALGALPSGDVLVGGNFNKAGSAPANSIAKFRFTTNSWVTLGSGVAGSNFEATARAIAILPNGDAIIGGNFLTAGGQLSEYFARYTFGSSCPLDVTCSSTVDENDFFNFLSIWFAGPPGGTCTGCVADWNGNGTIDADDVFAYLSDWFAFGPGNACP